MRSNHLFLASFVVGLLAFQGWLAKYIVVDYAEFPPARIVLAGAGAGAGTGTGTETETGRELWNRTAWVPEVLEKKLFQISVARRAAITIKGNTLVDADVELDSAKAFAEYLPRAFQLGLLSPLPEFWRGEGSTPAMTVARKIMGGVTSIFYVCLVGLLAGIAIFRKNLSFWIILSFCLLGILVYAFTMPNVGSLMRYRYGFYMVLISFGAASIAELMLNWRGSRPEK